MIALCWDGTPDALYIRGHIPFERAHEIVADSDDSGFHRLGVPYHAYAFWACMGWSEYNHTLVEKNEPGRGRFKVTVFQVIGDRSVDEMDYICREMNRIDALRKGGRDE